MVSATEDKRLFWQALAWENDLFFPHLAHLEPEGIDSRIDALKHRVESQAGEIAYLNTKLRHVLGELDRYRVHDGMA